MKSHALFTILLAVCLLSPECQKGGGQSPQQATQIRHAIVNYLECDDCEDGELEAVLKLGVVAVPSLAAALNQGPSQTNLEMLRRSLANNFRKLKEYEQTHPEAKVPGTEQQYVKTYTDNYVAGYQAKAAIALGSIGGADARRALEEAAGKAVREEVQAAIKASLEKVK
jgi:hypothetical protein